MLILAVVATMLVGGLAGALWARLRPQGSGAHPNRAPSADPAANAGFTNHVG